MNNILLKINYYLVLILPLMFVLGNAAINLYLFSLIFYLFFYIKDVKKIILENKKISLFIFFFYFYLFLNSIFIAENSKSIFFSLGLLKIIILFFFIRVTFQNLENKIFRLFYLWIFFFLFLEVDAFIQFITGYNLLGFPSEKFFKDLSCDNSFLTTIFVFFNLSNEYICKNILSVSRLGGMFGDELVLGGFLSYFFPLLFGINFNKNLKIVIFFLIFTLLIVLISGERMSFLLLIFSIFLMIILFKPDPKKIIFLFAILILFISSLSFSPSLKKRYFEVIYIVQEYKNQNKNLPYISIWRLSLFNFKENILFGVGIKNFRNNCSINNPAQKFIIDEFGKNSCRNHSHNIFLEILAETGLIGFFFFLTSCLFLIYNAITKYRIKKNIYSASCLTSISIILFPLKTSGAIFSTFYGTFIFFLLFLSYELLNLNNKTNT